MIKRLRLVAACGLILGLWSVRAEGRKPLGLAQEFPAPPLGDPKDPPPPVKPAACPVAKPTTVPEALKATFSTDAKVDWETRRKELVALADGEKNEECAEALRWLAHQNDVDKELRNQALIVLGTWHMPWLPRDLDAMTRDPLQPDAWRAQCVTHLAMHYSTFVDISSFKHLEALLEGQDPVLRDTALLEMARLDGMFHWETVNPKMHVRIVEKVGAVLAEGRGDALVKGLQAAALLELNEKTPVVEAIAGEAKQPVEARVAAVKALAVLARAESLAVLDVAAKSEQAELVKEAQAARPFALVAQLRSSDLKRREQGFQGLRGLGEKAHPALARLLDEKESEAQALARTILGQDLIEKAALKPIERKGMKRYGEDPETKKEGDKNILLDIPRRLIAIEGEFILERGALEYVVVCKGENAKVHESVLALEASPLDICYALLACNYTYAKEFHENGKINLPKEAGILLSVEYEHEYATPAGKKTQRIRVPISLLIWNRKTNQPMKHSPWAFTGSRVEKMPDGKMILMAMIEKSVAAIMTDPNALLNTPLDSATAANVNPQQGAFYEINRALVPKQGTKCSLFFEPWGGGELKAEDIHDGGAKNAALEAEKTP